MEYEDEDSEIYVPPFDPEQFVKENYPMVLDTYKLDEK